MEWKEHVAWLAPIAMTMVAYVSIKYKRSIIDHRNMRITQGLLSTLIADTAPEDLRGTAFGVFNLVTGVALLLASIVAGALWNHFDPQATFLIGAAFTALSIGGFVWIQKRRPDGKP